MNSKTPYNISNQLTSATITITNNKQTHNNKSTTTITITNNKQTHNNKSTTITTLN